MYIRGTDHEFNIIGRKKYMFAFSGLLIVISIVALAVLGLNLGLEFKGGYQLRLTLNQAGNQDDINAMVGAIPEFAGKSTVQLSNNNTTVIIKLPTVDNETALVTQLQGQIEQAYGFSSAPEQEQVGSEWGHDVSVKAIISLAVFLGLILIYISFRFEFKMAVSGIVALIHDTIITVGIYALTQRTVTSATIIAFLTILGYSLYDTIVVFDRVNENVGLLGRTTRKTYGEMVNDSVNQTLVRSINTTLVTLIPITAILIFGGNTLKDFAFALFIGVFLGAYSSVFLASPLLAVWKEREPRFEAVKVKSGAGVAAREAVMRKKAKPGAAPAKGTARASVVKAKGAPPKEQVEESKSQPAPKPKATPGAQRGEATTKPAPKKPAPKKAPAKPGPKKTTKGPSSKKKKKKR